MFNCNCTLRIVSLLELLMCISLLKNRPRLISAFLFGLVLVFFLPQSWSIWTRSLCGWNAAVWSYLTFIFWLIAHTTPARVAILADQEDEAAVLILIVLAAAAVASLVAIILELGTIKNLAPLDKVIHYVITLLTVLGSWCLVATLFTFHYARLYYRSPKENRALHFPDSELHPDYGDFLYFSFTIAVAAQTSDVSLASRSIRKVALAQSVLSFWFNMAILGLSINIAAGVVGG